METDNGVCLSVIRVGRTMLALIMERALLGSHAALLSVRIVKKKNPDHFTLRISSLVGDIVTGIMFELSKTT